MFQESRMHEQDVLDYQIYTDVNKGRLDLIVLRYMARSVHLTLLKEVAAKADAIHWTLRAAPTLSYFEERRRRMHRIAIYDLQQLQVQRDLAFVGFVSRKQQPLSASIVEDIHEVDRKLVVELVGTPGMLSYSSLELRTGNWYNLVLFNDLITKKHIKNSETHRYAAYQLAPRYYEWIRLHSGIVQGGIARCDLVLQKTKRYTFQMISTRPVVRELTIENITLDDEPPCCAPKDKQQTQIHLSLSLENSIAARSVNLPPLLGSV
jgi:hypothetical protein